MEIGNFASVRSIPIDPSRICSRDITVSSRLEMTPQQYAKDLQLLIRWYRSRKYQLDELVTHEFELAEVEQGIKLHREWKCMKVVVTP